MHNLITPLKNVIITAGKMALKKRKTGLIVDYKNDKSPVSNADKEISDFIYENLRKLTPYIPIICEERPPEVIEGNIFWLIDPIDGTKSYIRGEDTYTINIGLIEDTSPVLGFIYQPSFNKLYYTDAERCLKIEQNSTELPFNSSRLQYSHNAVIGSNNLNMATQEFLKKHNIENVISISSSIKLCLIAEGTADIYPKFGNTMEWDLAAGHALIKATGGNIVDFEGHEISYGKANFHNPHFYAYSRSWYERLSPKTLRS